MRPSQFTRLISRGGMMTFLGFGAGSYGLQTFLSHDIRSMQFCGYSCTSAGSPYPRLLHVLVRPDLPLAEMTAASLANSPSGRKRSASLSIVGLVTRSGFGKHVTAPPPLVFGHRPQKQKGASFHGKECMVQELRIACCPL